MNPEEIPGEEESGVRSQESGVRSQESGVRSQESGVRSQESGVRSQESGVRSYTILVCTCTISIFGTLVQLGVPQSKTQNGIREWEVGGREQYLLVPLFQLRTYPLRNSRQFFPDGRDRFVFC
jgi:hypothetical protein